MKQAIFLLIIVFLFSTSPLAQLNKKNWLVGGNGTFSSTNDNFSATTVAYEYTRTNIQLSPSIGYFIKDKLAVGIKSSISWRKNKGLSVGSTQSTDTYLRTDFGPSIRYYFLEKEKPFNILADLSYQFGNVKFIESKDKGIRNNLSIMLGPVIYFNSSIGIEFLVGYKTENEKLTTSTNVPQYFYTNTKKGFLVSIGFQIHLEKL